MTKKELRALIKEKAAALSDEYKKKADIDIQRNFLDSPAFPESSSLFIYMSVPGEPATDEIIKASLNMGKKVYVPKCISKGHMLAVRINENTKFISGYMGIPEPDSFCEETDICIDTAIIPCISADFDGKRLGHGAGFYDIFLQNQRIKKICLCYEKLISPHIPMEENDVYMDAVITEKGIFSK